MRESAAMRKLLGTVVVLVTMAIMLPGAARPQTVGACGWYLERSTFTNQWVWDNAWSMWTTINYEVDTYNDGCGDRVYASRTWTGNGDFTWLNANVRVWVCGAYQGAWSSGAVWTNSVVMWSPAFWYWPWCGRQADNAGSWSAPPRLTPGTSRYLNAG
jgi:hypothetical protein